MGLRINDWSKRTQNLAARGVALLLCVSISFAAGDVFAQFQGENFLTGDADFATTTNATDMAVGSSAAATGGFSTAIGILSKAGGANATALGHSSDASGNFSSAVGVLAESSGTWTTAIGAGAKATGSDSSTAVGVFSMATGRGAIAIGRGAISSDDSTTAVGELSTASGFRSTAVGTGASATGATSIALGNFSIADDGDAIAIGSFSVARGLSSTAVGGSSVANGIDSSALGAGSSAAFTNSTAIGHDAETTRDNQMALGTATNTYTAAGISSAASAAAQSGPVELVTSDASGNLATTDAASLGLASIEEVGRNTEGVAMAMAMSGIPTVLPNCSEYAISTNWGTFDGENAISVGGSARVVGNLFFNGGGVVGTNRGIGGGRAGMTYAW